MKIDKIKVQKLIDNTIGPEYIINEIVDTSKYIFISWKHKEYDIDDERGHRIGVGPVAFNKLTKEYKLLGTGDMLGEEYHRYLFKNVNNKEHFEIPQKEEIKNNILRRMYVNNEDIHFLGHQLEQEFGDLNYHLSFNKSVDMNWTTQAIINIEGTEAMKFIINFWKEIGFEYKTISESEILVWKTKN